MGGINIKSSRRHWITVLLCASLSVHFASAGLLNWRQDDGAIAASAAIAAASGVTREAPSAVSAISAATAPAATAATAPDTAKNAPAPTATTATPASNGTHISNSTVPAVAAATSEFSNPLNATNDPNECHITHEVGAMNNPFCKPSTGQIVLVGKEYEVTWDQSLLPPNSTNTIALLSLEDLGHDSTDNMTMLQETKAPNSQGAVFLKMSPLWLNKKASTTNLTLSLRNDKADNEPLPGPTITLQGTNNSTTNNTTHSSPTSKAKKLGEAVGIPMGLVFLIIAVALIAAYICMRKRRAGLGYGAGKKAARNQRMEAAVSTPGAAGGGHHRRDASFHDEPTRGMELQDRGRGLTGEDNWDWGSPVGSPTVGGGGGNAFRDEMQRQKGGRGV